MLHHITRRKTLQVGILIVVSTILFGNTFQNEFLWDDPFLITENRYIQNVKNIPYFFTHHYWNERHPFPGQYRPLRTASLAVDYYFWKGWPAGYHLTNLLLHVVNVVLVFWLASFIAEQGNNRQKETAGRRFFMSLPFLTALFFAAHPIHTESINLVKNRSDLLAFLFFLVSFLLFIKHITVTGRLARRVFILCAWISFVPAVLSKEMALTLPGVLALYVACFTSGSEQKKMLVRIVPYGLIISVYFWFKHLFINPAAPLPARISIPGDTWQHSLAVIKTIGSYLKMLVVPFPLNAEHAFDLPVSIWSSSVVLPLLALVLIAVVAVRAGGRRRPIIIFAIGWLALTLLPAANIVYLASRPLAEQRLYIPSFGFCLLLGYGIEKLLKIQARSSASSRPVIAGGLLAVSIAGLYAVITIDRNADWRDAITFYSKTVLANPESSRIYNNLGIALSRAGKYEEAISRFHTALQINPNYTDARYNLGISLQKIGRVKEAIDHYEMVVRFNPDCAESHNNLGAALAKACRFEEAFSHYYEALRLRPDYVKAMNNIGVELMKQGDIDQAVSFFRKALEINPDHVDAGFNLGVALMTLQDFQQAVTMFSRVLDIDPNHERAKSEYEYCRERMNISTNVFKGQ